MAEQDRVQRDKKQIEMELQRTESVCFFFFLHLRVIAQFVGRT